jgi:hypothetical protein
LRITQIERDDLRRALINLLRWFERMRATDAVAGFSDADWSTLNRLIEDAQHWLVVGLLVDADAIEAGS